MILELSGVLAYEAMREEAIAGAQALALRAIAERGVTHLLARDLGRPRRACGATKPRMGVDHD